VVQEAVLLISVLEWLSSRPLVIAHCWAAKARPALTLDLSAISPEQGFVIQGDRAGDTAGRSVSSAGDINNDGFADVIVGAPYADGGGTDSGESYVVFGSAGGFGAPDASGRSVLDLTTLSASDGSVLFGDAAGDLFGISRTSGGDINGDGFDDFIIGAPLGDDGGRDAGEAYVLFGGPEFALSGDSGRHVIDATTISAEQGFVIQGAEIGDQAGSNVSSAGDVNGDGFDDLIVGARFSDDGGTNAGASYVLFGSEGGFGKVDTSGRRIVDLGALPAEQGFVIRGDTAGDEFGRSVSDADDVNGDGFDDIIIGAYQGDDGGSAAGEAYVLFGSPSGFGTPGGSDENVVDLSTLSEEQGFVIQGDAAGDETGGVVSGAGDVNGDGYNDLIVGARYGDDAGTDAGEAYVIFGTDRGFGVADATGRQVVDLTCLAPSEGFIVQGAAPGDSAGWSVSSAGDVNGDGFDDLIVGARFADGGGNDAGTVYVLFGSSSRFGERDSAGRKVIDLADLGAGQGFIIQGDASGDNLGRGVSEAGDVNDDGFDDLIVGAPYGDDGGTNTGEAYVVFGQPTPVRDRIAGILEWFAGAAHTDEPATHAVGSESLPGWLKTGISGQIMSNDAADLFLV
jgi:hypothetical protein